MKRCELCKGEARTYCESDQASLCLDCDAKVHSANFLVARHSRVLLCRVCRSLTRWVASGAKLGPAFYFCEKCVNKRRGDENDVEEAVGEVLDVVETQVVSWSPPPTPETSSSSEESVSGGEAVDSRKRCRSGNASSDLQFEDDEACSSSRINIFAPPKKRATGSISRQKSTPLQNLQRVGRAEVFGSDILGSLRKLHQEETGSGEAMVESFTFSGPSI